MEMKGDPRLYVLEFVSEGYARSEVFGAVSDADAVTYAHDILILTSSMEGTLHRAHPCGLHEVMCHLVNGTGGTGVTMPSYGWCDVCGARTTRDPDDPRLCSWCGNPMRPHRGRA